ncbi:MAG: hypothetical protein AAF743_17000, partial [Planctomycetota bacterium]
MTVLNVMPPAEVELSPEQVRRIYDTCIADAEFLKSFEGEARTLSDDPADIARADELKAAWADWLDDARKVLARVGATPGVVDKMEHAKLKGFLLTARGTINHDPANTRRILAEVEAGHFYT